MRNENQTHSNIDIYRHDENEQKNVHSLAICHKMHRICNVNAEVPMLARPLEHLARKALSLRRRLTSWIGQNTSKHNRSELSAGKIR